MRKTAASIKDFKDYKDLERLQNLRFLRDVDPYFVLCRGIRYGDIGLIRRAIDPLILLFTGAKKWAYSREFLNLKHLPIDTEYFTPQAAKAIAGTLLVNPSGKRDGWFPIDLANESLNRDIKDVRANRRTSTSFVRLELSEFCTLNAIFFKPLMHKIHSLWGRNTAGNHTRLPRNTLLLNLPRCLRRTMSKNKRTVLRNIDWSKDYYVVGYDALPT